MYISCFNCDFSWTGPNHGYTFWLHFILHCLFFCIWPESTVSFKAFHSCFCVSKRHENYPKLNHLLFYILSISVLTVYIAEDLNEYFAKNHKLFTKHQYFDSSGLFISLMMSMPLLFISAFIVVSLNIKICLLWTSYVTCVQKGSVTFWINLFKYFQGNWIHQSTLLMQQVKKMQMEKAIMNAGKKTQWYIHSSKSFRYYFGVLFFENCLLWWLKFEA